MGDHEETRREGEGGNKGGGKDEVIRVARKPTSSALLFELEHASERDRVRGLGAGHTGSTVFYLQRLTALALIPLVIWFAVSMVFLSGGTQAEAAAWLAWPLNAAVMGLFILIALRHAVIGMRIIFEDYLRDVRLRRLCLLAVQAAALALGVATVIALIHLF